MTMRLCRTLALGLSLGLAACAHSPEPALYTLAPVAGMTHSTAPATVELRRIGLAGYLDRSEIVHADSGYRLHVSGGDRWGEPLDDMIGRVLAEDLTQRLPGSTILSEAGAISASGDAIVEINVQRFDADRDGQLILTAQASVRDSRTQASRATRTLRLTVPPEGPGTGALVAAMSTALGQLADTVAGMIRDLPSGPVPTSTTD